MKIKIVTIIILLIFLTSCVKKKVQLPIIQLKGIGNIQNHSSIWVFFKIKDQDTLALLNKNNKLLNTHWIFNIDKKLPMQKVLPHLKKMQENRNKDSMHKKSGMLNYFSYMDPVSKKVYLTSFKQTTFVFTNKKYEEFLNKLYKYQIIELRIKNNKLYLNQLEIKMNQLAEQVNHNMNSDSKKNTKIIFSYEGNTYYQNYLQVKAILSNSKIDIETIEFIYSS